MLAGQRGSLVQVRHGHGDAAALGHKVETLPVVLGGFVDGPKGFKVVVPAGVVKVKGGFAYKR